MYNNCTTVQTFRLRTWADLQTIVYNNVATQQWYYQLLGSSNIHLPETKIMEHDIKWILPNREIDGGERDNSCCWAQGEA